jgi:hypothetical protein
MKKKSGKKKTIAAGGGAPCMRRGMMENGRLSCVGDNE